MSAPLKELPPEELRLKIEGTRRRLEEWARRLAALRERLVVAAQGQPADHPPDHATDRQTDAADERSGPQGSGAGGAAGVPLFHRVGAVGGALDDVELHFEVLDTEDPGRPGR